MDDGPVSYVKKNLPQVRDAIRFFDGKRPLLQFGPKELVLDVGCGPGDLSCKLLTDYFPKGTSMIGGDWSRKMLEHAEKNFSYQHLNFKLMTIDSEKLFDQWATNHFDKIISNYCLHWVQNQRLAAENMFKLLKFGGRVYLQFLASHPFIDTYKAIGRLEEFSQYTKKFHPSVKHIELKNPEVEYAEILMSAGFCDVSVKTVTSSFYWPTMEDAIVSFRENDPYVIHIPAGIMETYQNKLQELLTSNDILKPAEDGSGWLRMDYKLVDAYGRKPPEEEEEDPEMI